MRTATEASASGSRAPTSGTSAARCRRRRTKGVRTGAITALTTSTSSRVTSLKILVTGGAGFIGSHVVDAYITAGHEVAVLDNLATGREQNVNPGARLYRADVRDLPQVRQAIGDFKPDVVNHHAAQAEVPKSVADPGNDASINVVGGLNVLRAAVDHSVR